MNAPSESSMFLLNGITHSGFSIDVLGVFSSYNKAREVLDDRLAKIAEDLIAEVYSVHDYDDYCIREYIVDDIHSALN